MFKCNVLSKTSWGRLGNTYQILCEWLSHPFGVILQTLFSVCVVLWQPNVFGLILGTCLAIWTAYMIYFVFSGIKWMEFCLWHRALMALATLSLASLLYANVFFFLLIYCSSYPTEHFRLPDNARFGGGLRQKAAHDYLETVKRDCKRKLLLAGRISDSGIMVEWNLDHDSEAQIESSLRSLIENYFSRTLANRTFDADKSELEYLDQLLERRSVVAVQQYITKLAQEWETFYLDNEGNVEPGKARIDCGMLANSIGEIYRDLEQRRHILKGDLKRLRSSQAKNVTQDMIVQKEKDIEDVGNLLSTDMIAARGLAAEHLLKYLAGNPLSERRALYLGTLVFTTMLHLTEGYGDLVPNSDTVLVLMLSQCFVYVLLFFIIMPMLLQENKKGNSGREPILS